MEPTLTLTLTINEANTVLAALENLPHKAVAQLIPKILSQAQAQAQAAGGETDEQDK